MINGSVVTLNKIKLLSDDIINQIAAGEIVEGPYSALKEIIENSVDANAKNIDIVLKDAGKTKIVVIDDGDGISKEDLEMCVMRHATSKLSGANLFDIHSYGFRGEAIPSIGAISDMSIESNGYKIGLKFAEKSDITESSVQNGTRVCVSNIFDRLPVRLKFLKSDSTELARCINVVENFALTKKDINFTLRADNKIVSMFNDNSLEARVSRIYGQDLVEKAVYFEESNEKLSVKGYLFHPTHSKHTSSNSQRLFVNNRIVKDRMVSVATKIGYRNIIDPRRYPLTLLFIEIDPFFVDINVSPTKSEVKFRDEVGTQKFLVHVISKYVERFNKIALDFGILKDEQMVNVAENSYATDKIPTSHLTPPVFTPKYEPKIHNSFIEKSLDSHMIAQKVESKVVEIPSVLDEPTSIQVSETKISDPFWGKAIAQVFDTYIIAVKEETQEVFIIDQHAVHEKMTMNKLIEQLNDGNAKYLLRPEIINISQQELLKLTKTKGKLEECGFKLDLIGQVENITDGANALSPDQHLSVIVNAIPGIMENDEAFQFLKDIAEDTNDNCEMEDYIKHRLANIACHNSIRAGRKLSVMEMDEMLRCMEKTDNVFQCNHYRPSFIKFSKDDLAKMFERT